VTRRGSSRRKRGCSLTFGQWLLAGLLLVGVYLIFQLQRCSSDAGGVAAFLGRLTSPKAAIGLVAGHGGNDSGAVCADGLREADINKDVAERTASILRRAGFRVDLLKEFDPQLAGYTAAAFVSIHTDSCVNDISGFKVARYQASGAPAPSDRLVAALYREYGAATGLQPHTNTITDDMRNYHAFRSIAPTTPAAIIELGFMGSDRNLLTRRADVAARGVARGIVAFIEGEKAATE
jgi:N-acetylmuramoyl-L-alanine amidase